MYNYRLDDIKSVEAAASLLNGYAVPDPTKFGVVATPTGLGTELLSAELMTEANGLFTNPDNKEASKIGDPNVVFLNPSSFGANPTRAFDEIMVDKSGKQIQAVNATEVVVHGAGHNAAQDHYHRNTSSGKYEYNQSGLQSNQRGMVYPTKQNTMDIINDVSNRKTLAPRSGKKGL